MAMLLLCLLRFRVGAVVAFRVGSTERHGGEFFSGWGDGAAIFVLALIDEIFAFRLPALLLSESSQSQFALID